MKFVFLFALIINYISGVPHVRVESATPAPSVNDMKTIVPSTIVPSAYDINQNMSCGE